MKVSDKLRFKSQLALALMVINSAAAIVLSFPDRTAVLVLSIAALLTIAGLVFVSRSNCTGALRGLGETTDGAAEFNKRKFDKPFRGNALLSLVENTARSPTTNSADNTVDVDITDQNNNDALPVNLDAFREAMREVGIEEAVDTTLATFRNEMPSRMSVLSKALEVDDVASIASAAHAMKSAAGAIHAEALAATMNSLEHAANEGDVSTAKGLALEAGTEFSEVMTYLRQQGEEVS